MSGRKTGTARVTKPVRRRAPEPDRGANAGEVAKSPSANAASGSTADIPAAIEALAADIDRALAEGRTGVLTVEAIQTLMAAACRSYSAQVEAMGDVPPLAAGHRVTSTDVMVTASGLLKSANLAVFELGMWQSWTGR